MHNNYFLEKLKMLESDEHQLHAYNSNVSTLVTAGPGSGKTAVLTLKAKKILDEQKNSPRGLACITYSREAVREIENRMKLLGAPLKKNCFIGTIHSFCLSEVLIPFASIYPQYNIPNPIKLISARERQALFKKINNNIGFDGLRIEDMDKELSRNICVLSTVEIPPHNAVLKVALQYEKELLTLGYVDYILLVTLAVKLISNEKYIRDVLDAKYPWILIDEYQDLGKALHEMILSFLKDTNIKVFAVGDADQSIYDFQGASPEYLSELKNSSHIAEKIILLNNYRSPSKILQASEAILGKSLGYIAVGELKDYDAKINFHVCDYGMEEQYHKAVELIKELHNEGTLYHEIVIVLGKNSEIKEFSELCNSEAIPYYTVKRNFQRTNTIKWIEKILQWTNRSVGITFDEIYFFWEQLVVSCGYQLNHENKIFFRRELYKKITSCSEPDISVIDYLDRLIEKLDLLNYLESLLCDPDECDNIVSFMDFFRSDKFKDYKLKDYIDFSTPKNQIVVSTRHGVKGLEFEHVIMLGMEDDSFPSYFSKGNKIKEQEEERICFVCVSRAKKSCTLLRSKVVAIPTKRGIWDKPATPSKFWTVLEKVYDSDV